MFGLEAAPLNKRNSKVLGSTGFRLSFFGSEEMFQLPDNKQSALERQVSLRSLTEIKHCISSQKKKCTKCNHVEWGVFDALPHLRPHSHRSHRPHPRLRPFSSESASLQLLLRLPERRDSDMASTEAKGRLLLSLWLPRVSNHCGIVANPIMTPKGA